MPGYGCARDSNPEPADPEAGSATVETVRVRPDSRLARCDLLGLIWRCPKLCGGVAALW